MSASGRPALRLLFFYDCIYPESVGGVEHRNAELARALVARGHRVTLAGFSAGPPRLEDGVEILPVAAPSPVHGSERRTGGDALRLARAAAHLDLRPYDLIETANIPFAHLFPLALRCRLRRRPLVVTWHEYWGRYWRTYAGPWRWRALAAAEWVAAQLGAAALAVSELTARRVSARRRTGEVHWLPNGVPVAAVRAAAAEARESGPPLVSAGRLLRDKRLDLLLRAVALLAPRLAGPLLTIVGDGPERGPLEELARDLGVADRVRFRGRLATSQEVWRELGRARVAVQPSAREGFGLFPLEAMAAGLPVVFCESPDSAVTEVVRPGEEGLGTPPDPEALARALEALLADPAEHTRLGTGARRRAEEFDWGGVAARLEEIFYGVMRARGRRASVPG